MSKRKLNEPAPKKPEEEEDDDEEDEEEEDDEDEEDDDDDDKPMLKNSKPNTTGGTNDQEMKDQMDTPPERKKQRVIGPQATTKSHTQVGSASTITNRKSQGEGSKSADSLVKEIAQLEDTIAKECMAIDAMEQEIKQISDEAYEISSKLDLQRSIQNDLRHTKTGLSATVTQLQVKVQEEEAKLQVSKANSRTFTHTFCGFRNTSLGCLMLIIWPCAIVAFLGFAFVFTMLDNFLKSMQPKPKYF